MRSSCRSPRGCTGCRRVFHDVEVLVDVDARDLVKGADGMDVPRERGAIGDPHLAAMAASPRHA